MFIRKSEILEKLAFLDGDLAILEARVKKLEKSLKEPTKTKTAKVSKATKVKG